MSLLRNSRSCGEIIATGSALCGAGTGPAGGAAGAGAGAGTSIVLSLRASRGAMMAFSTLVEPHSGQATRPFFACLS